MARFVICLTLFLQACASHVVRCDARLQPINAPAAKSVLSEEAAPDGEPAP
jgi:hypothetical protein